MLISIVIALIGLLSTWVSAAVLPARQEPPPPDPTSITYAECIPIYRYRTITVTEHPDTVTIAAVDPVSISQQFNTQASIDTIEVIDDRVHAPTGQTPNPTPTRYTHTAAASLYEATEALGDGMSVYYVSKPAHGPPESTDVATTTITVIPTPAALDGGKEVYSTINTTIVSTATVTAVGIWNTSTPTSGSAIVGYGVPLTTSVGTGYAPPSLSSDTFDILTTTITTYVSTTTKNVTALTTASTIVNASFFPGYGLTSTQTSGQPAGLVPRQTCVIVDAGPYGTWCNNWDGSTVISFSTYNTTIFPKPKSTRQPTIGITTVTVIPTPATSIPPSNPGKSTPAPTSEALPPGSTPETPSSGSNTTTPAGAGNNTQHDQPESCGEVGEFTIDFETFPDSGRENPLIFNPWRHFWWGAFWTYAPPPVQAYSPQDGTHLAKCNPSNNNTVLGSPNAGSVPPDGFGAGPRVYTDVYWFDAHSAYVACENPTRNTRATCQFNATAWKWDGTNEFIFETHPYTIAPCLNDTNCHLQEITFPGEWNDLTALNFTATVAGETRAFYMDSLHLEWSNNSCAAGLKRVNSRK